MIAFETFATLGICWALGAITGWGMAYYIVAHKCKRKRIMLREAFKECDTCGQIDSDVRDGLCAWCQRVYAKGSR